MPDARRLLAALLGAAALCAHAGPSNHTFAWSNYFRSDLVVFDGTNFFDLREDRRGWVDELGRKNNSQVGANFIAGVCGSSDECQGDDLERRNYFRFDMPGIAQVTWARLYLEQPGPGQFEGKNGFSSTASALTYTIWDVSTNPVTQPGRSVEVFNDLGSGIAFGSVIVDSSSNGGVVAIDLNAAGLAMLEAAARGGGYALIGGAVTAVPEPATFPLTALGLCGLAAVARVRSRRRCGIRA